MTHLKKITLAALFIAAIGAVGVQITGIGSEPETVAGGCRSCWPD
ncbi:hypothetical protein [Oleisolibacter albus]|nr:hypothetical protein [Oleisolibacter albus]